MHCNATLWDYVPSVAKPLVGLRVDSSAPESNAVSINASVINSMLQSIAGFTPLAQ